MALQSVRGKWNISKPAFLLWRHSLQPPPQGSTPQPRQRLPQLEWSLSPILLMLEGPFSPLITNPSFLSNMSYKRDGMDGFGQIQPYFSFSLLYCFLIDKLYYIVYCIDPIERATETVRQRRRVGVLSHLITYVEAFKIAECHIYSVELLSSELKGSDSIADRLSFLGMQKYDMG